METVGSRLSRSSLRFLSSVFFLVRLSSVLTRSFRRGRLTIHNVRLSPNKSDSALGICNGRFKFTFSCRPWTGTDLLKVLAEKLLHEDLVFIAGSNISIRSTAPSKRDSTSHFSLALAAIAQEEDFDDANMIACQYGC
jgi:hypothetical protein